MGTALGWAVLGVVITGFIGVVAMMRSDIGRLGAKIVAGIGRLDAKIDAQTGRIDHLTERVEEHLSAHHSAS